MKRRRSERGFAAVEFGLILPVLVLFCFGTVEFGLLMYNKQVLTNASREGARSGIVYQDPRVDDNSIKNVINNYSLAHLVTFGQASPPDIVIVRPGPEEAQDLKITVSYQYTFLLLPKFLLNNNAMLITAQSVMRYE